MRTSDSDAGKMLRPKNDGFNHDASKVLGEIHHEYAAGASSYLRLTSNPFIERAEPVSRRLPLMSKVECLLSGNATVSKG